MVGDRRARGPSRSNSWSADDAWSGELRRRPWPASELPSLAGRCGSVGRAATVRSGRLPSRVTVDPLWFWPTRSHCCRAQVRWPTARDCLSANSRAERPRVWSCFRLSREARGPGCPPGSDLPGWHPAPRPARPSIGRARQTKWAQLVLSSPPEGPRPADHLQRAVAQFGRAPVSKTGGWGFESLLPCSPTPVRRPHT